jgi:photosystem II stability/assembly factor-like uncharacterized protein
MPFHPRRVLALGFAILAGYVIVIAQRAQQPAGQSGQTAGDSYRQLRFRYIGPVGNRTDAVAGVPGDPLTYYVGAASGGIFKTTDGGTHWQPIFDDQPVSSIGSIAVAPSDPSTVWAGTGESFIRSHISVGQGIFKSTDAGRTWSLAGLEKTGRIGRIVIDPRNPDVVFACALGHAYGPQPERGVFRTTDGGKNWERVLFVDENTGCSDIAMVSSSPTVLFAGTWQLEIHTWGRTSGGPGSGLFKSRDGGTTWQRLSGHGLPERPVGKVGIAIARSNPDTIYALIETGDGVPWDGKPTDRGQLWRSDDGGSSWLAVSSDRQLRGRTHYYTRAAVNTDNEHEIYFLSSAFSRSLDGGRTLEEGGRGGGAGAPGGGFGASSPGGDNHDMWIDPLNGNRMIVANDSGVSISVTRGRTWNRIQLPIAQMYHVTVDNQIPYNVYGNKQDGSSYRGPSNSRQGGFGGGEGGGRGGAIGRALWHPVGGGESGFATPDPVDNNIVWSSGTGSGSRGGYVERFDERNHQGRVVEVWPEETTGASAADVRFRFNWEFPIAISPHDHNKVYVGSQVVHQTTDGGNSWQIISPDLSRNDRSRMVQSGGLTPDNIGVEYAGMVFAIAESPKQAGLIWAGTNDGLVQVTRDGGKTWTSVTANIPGLPESGTIGSIDASRWDAATAYLTVDAHQVNNRDPFVYKTGDYGKTWKAITNGIPRSMLSYAHCIREDPVRRGLLYLGTENALYVSVNDGDTWQPLQLNLPHAPVYWIAVQEHFNDLVIATYGRGFWILDDLSPIQRLSADVADAGAHLFAPRTAYRFRNVSNPAGETDDPTAGQNPPYGATINYWLKSAPQGEVRLVVQDSGGRTVRTITGSRQPGINRITWDLRHDPTREIRLRTSPPFAPEVRVGPDGWRPKPGGGRISMLTPPGTYTIKLAAGGQELTEKLVVAKDPSSTGTETDIQTQTKLLTAITEDLNSVADAINQIELIRAQLVGLGGMMAGDQGASSIRSAADDLDKKLLAIEDNLFQTKETGRGQDGWRWTPKLVEKITHLAQGVGSSDFPPTMQDVAVQEDLRRQWATYRQALSQTLEKDVYGFNAMLKDRGLGGIIVQAPRRTSPE